MIDNGLFLDVERVLRRVLVSHSLRLSRAIGIPVDDAIQEHRMALASAMAGYDFNRSRGGLHKFADRVLRNNTLSLVYKFTTETRMPHMVCEVDGVQKVVKWRVSSLDEVTPDGSPSLPPPEATGEDPEQALIAREAHERRRVMLMRLLSKLSARERDVFECKCRPADEFLAFMRNINAEEATLPVIARFLGMDKNAVDYSLYQIRTKFTKLAEQEFPDLIEQHVADKTWPMIHHMESDSPSADFASKVIHERGLDPAPSEKRTIKTNGSWGFECQPYPWGAVMVLKNGAEYHTLVIEGRLNLVSGGVFGKADGTHKTIIGILPWYPKMVKAVGVKG
jgi:DNA-directed RNA polymerase specialized sigma24 family protein